MRKQGLSLTASGSAAAAKVSRLHRYPMAAISISRAKAETCMSSLSAGSSPASSPTSWARPAWPRPRFQREPFSSGPASGWSRLASNQDFSRQRKCEEEGRPLPQPAFDAHLAAMRLDDMFDDGQPQPRAALLARAGFVHAVKTLEHP